MQHREFDLLAFLMVMPVELECGVELLVFLLLLLGGGGYCCASTLDFVDIAHCSHGVWHGHSWVWLVEGY